MKCKKCGNDMRDEAKFCPYCGEKVEIIPADESSQNEKTEIIPEIGKNISVSEEKNEEKNGNFAPEREAAEIAEETRETPVQKEETVSAKKETEETKAEIMEISGKFNQRDDLFFVSGNSENAGGVPVEAVKKKKFPVFAVVFALILAVSVPAAYFIPTKIIPSIKYKNAEKLFSAADYEAAEAAFSELGNYSQSAGYIVKCRYEKAARLMADGLFPEAADAFTRLDGYEDSDELVRECMVKIAEKYLENGDLDAAMSTYTAAGMPDLAESAAAKRAEVLAGEENYFAAAEIAEKYCGKDVSDEYLYLGAEKARKDGDLKTAADTFYKLGNYKNSAALAEECTYGFYSAEYAEKGASEETARGFYFLGNFRNSKELFMQNAYEYGVKCLENSDYASAAAMFSNAAGYRDAAGQLFLARYGLGKSLESESPASARSIFAMLGNYMDSANRKKVVSQGVSESWYADGFTSVGDYRTAAFVRSDTVTVYCTAGTDSPSPPITVTVSLEDAAGSVFLAECENVRNSGSFSVNFPLEAVSAGTAKITVSKKDGGAVLREFVIYISEL